MNPTLLCAFVQQPPPRHSLDSMDDKIETSSIDVKYQTLTGFLYCRYHQRLDKTVCVPTFAPRSRQNWRFQRLSAAHRVLPTAEKPSPGKWGCSFTRPFNLCTHRVWQRLASLPNAVESVYPSTQFVVLLYRGIALCTYMLRAEETAGESPSVSSYEVAQLDRVTKRSNEQFLSDPPDLTPARPISVDSVS